jgi:ATPase subunit of ABC transporter with duplicated ATPase domains
MPPLFYVDPRRDARSQSLRPACLAASRLTCRIAIGQSGCGARLTVCSNVSIELHADELLLVGGPRGVGRTTLLQCLAGMRRPDAGAVSWGSAVAPHRVWRECELGARRMRARVAVLAEPSPGLSQQSGLTVRILDGDDADTLNDRRTLAAAAFMLGVEGACIWALRSPNVACIEAVANRLTRLRIAHRIAWLHGGELRSR